MEITIRHRKFHLVSDRKYCNTYWIQTEYRLRVSTIHIVSDQWNGTEPYVQLLVFFIYVITFFNLIAMYFDLGEGVVMYETMKSTCLLYFYAFIVQKYFTAMNFCRPDVPRLSYMRSWQLPSSTLIGSLFQHVWPNLMCILNGITQLTWLWMCLGQLSKVNNAYAFWNTISWSMWIIILLTFGAIKNTSKIK